MARSLDDDDDDEGQTSRACARAQKDLAKLRKKIAWKWRWAADALRSDILSRNRENQVDRLPWRCEQCRQRICVCSVPSEECGEEGKVSARPPQEGLTPAVLSAWRAYARALRLEKKALAMIDSLDMMVSALPWWIRRVGQRRLIERCFYRWRLHPLRQRRKQKKQQQQLKQLQQRQDELVDIGEDPGLTKRCPACRHDLELKRKATPVKPSTLKPKTSRKAWGSSAGRQDYPAWQSQVAGKRTSGFASRSSSNGLLALQNSLQNEMEELELQLSDHIRTLQDDKFQARGAPIWKGSWNSTWEVCNNLLHSIEDAKKHLAFTQNRRLERTRPWKHRDFHEEQKLDLPGGFQRSQRAEPGSGGVSRQVSRPPSRRKQQLEQSPAPACNLTLEPGAAVNLTCERKPSPCTKDGKWPGPEQQGRLCITSQYADYLRDEIKRLKTWQAEHESQIKQEIRKTDLKPEVEILL